MTPILEIPELVALDGPGGLIRIPNQIDIPVTPRVLRLIDTPEFQRLKKISQLGLVAFVYPGAHHNRFEHSLGVYRMALLFLQQLSHQPRFSSTVTPHEATVLILAALFHDLGHWPFCHPIEDLSLDQVPTHEQFGATYLRSESLRRLLKTDWQVDAEEVIALINKRSTSPAHKPAHRLLSSILSGPIDVDKMDYLYRDSLHAGVPYGQNFDAPRLIRSLCLNRDGDRLAITAKGKTAAELMVFARYVMFSEVYWHHAVRSATAMFQRAFYRWYEHHQSHPEFGKMVFELFQHAEDELVKQLRDPAPAAAENLLNGLFGSQRSLYKRLATFSVLEGESIYRQLAQRPYPWLVQCSERLAVQLSDWIGHTVATDEVLIDAPPVGLEVQFDVQIHYPRDHRFVPLETVSPVVQTLARRQFDDYVKQVRIFVAPPVAEALRSIDDLTNKLAHAILQ